MTQKRAVTLLDQFVKWKMFSESGMQKGCTALEVCGMEKSRAYISLMVPNE